VGGKMCLRELEEDLRESLFKKIAYGVSDTEISDKDKDIVSKTTLMHILEQKEAYRGKNNESNNRRTYAKRRR
jgi:uncharacterized membrane protein YgaE (UPF0421/DUF939 family)